MNVADLAYSVYRAIDGAIDDGNFAPADEVEELDEPTIDNGYVTRLVTTSGQKFRILVQAAPGHEE